MDWELVALRQAVGEWRDQQVLGVCHLLNDHAQKAKEAFEKQLTDANFLDSMWDPAGFARDRIDQLMLNEIATPLRSYLSQASAELQSLDGRLAVIGEALRRSDKIVWPCSQVSAAEESRNYGDTSGQMPVPPQATQKVASTISGFFQRLSVGRRLREAGSAFSNAVGQASSATERAVQDKTGLYDRLRRAATRRIDEQWFGDRFGSPSVLGQVLRLIDEVAFEARAADSEVIARGVPI